MERSPLLPAVILVEPREEGNIGAAARAMANMGLDELVLVNPVARIGAVARAFAVGADGILAGARLAGSLSEALAPFHRVVGTTSARARELPSAPVTPRALPGLLRLEAEDSRTALLFGPEVSGLDNEQLSRCSPIVTVPCAPVQPTLNLSQAVLILAYELYLARLQADVGVETGLHAPANQGETEAFFAQLIPLLASVGFQRDDTFNGVVRDLRRLAARSGVTQREIKILRGICRRTAHALERR